MECDFYVCLHIRSSVLLLWEYVSQVEKLVKAAHGVQGRQNRGGREVNDAKTVQSWQ